MAKLEITGNVGAALKVHQHKETGEAFGVLRVCENEIRDGGEVVELWYSVFVTDKLLAFLQTREREIKGARVFVRGRFRMSMDPGPSGFSVNMKVTASELEIINYARPAEAAADPQGVAADPQAVQGESPDPQSVQGESPDPQSVQGEIAGAQDPQAVQGEGFEPSDPIDLMQDAAAADASAATGETGGGDWEGRSDGGKSRLAPISDQLREEKERKAREKAEAKARKADAGKPQEAPEVPAL